MATPHCPEYCSRCHKSSQLHSETIIRLASYLSSIGFFVPIITTVLYISFQECLTLMSQAERIIAAAHSLQLKLKQGVEFSGGQWEAGTTMKEVNTCIEVLLQSDELVLEKPSSSTLGESLRGLLLAHETVQVSAPMLHLY